MITPSEIFTNSIETLRGQYSEHRFFTERDVVWTVQLRMLEEIERLGLPYRVFNDYGMGQRQRADLAVLDNAGNVELAAEFKYEPSHDRNANFGGDIPKTKFPVVFWNEVEKDVQRVEDFVSSKRARVAYSVFIDEGNHFSWREAPSGSEWRQWDNGVSILWRAVEG